MNGGKERWREAMTNVWKEIRAEYKKMERIIDVWQWKEWEMKGEKKQNWAFRKVHNYWEWAGERDERRRSGARSWQRSTKGSPRQSDKDG